jgi:ribulose-phosphate 3-epimerase
VAEVVPTILTQTIEDYQEMVQRYEPFAERVHIDIGDGEFSPTMTVSVGQLYWPAGWRVDLHAMVARPSEYVHSLLELKPHTIIFHAEADEDLLPVIKALKQYGVRAGVAILKTTVPKQAAEYIKVADHVTIFDGDLGHNGGKASMIQLEKVRLIHAINPDVEIGWDGGANIDNVFTLGHGGVDVINVGEALASIDEPADMYQRLVREANKHGIV